MARPGQLRRLNFGRAAVIRMACVQRHHDLFERRIARALADTIDRAFDLTGTGLHARERVGDGHPEIIVTVHRHAAIFDALRVLDDASHQLGEFCRLGIPNGVGNVQCGRAGLDGGGEHFSQIGSIGAAGIFGAELHVFTKRPSKGDSFRHGFDHLRLRHLQLVFEVDVRRRNERMNARLLGVTNSLPTCVDVGFDRPGETRDRWSLSRSHRSRDARHRLQVARRGCWKTGFDDVDSHAGKLLGNLHLGASIQCRARRLFSIAQRRIEDSYVVTH